MSDLPNKVTKDDLDHLVAQSKTTFTNPAGTLTHCVITLPCGYTITGESACVDPANYNKELGEEYALEQAVDKLWPLEGYLLANDRYRASQPKSFFARMVFEHSDLHEKLSKLNDFLAKPKPEQVSQDQWDLMLDQKEHMTGYLDTLEKRMNLVELADLVSKDCDVTDLNSENYHPYAECCGKCAKSDGVKRDIAKNQSERSKK